MQTVAFSGKIIRCILVELIACQSIFGMRTQLIARCIRAPAEVQVFASCCTHTSKNLQQLEDDQARPRQATRKFPLQTPGTGLHREWRYHGVLCRSVLSPMAVTKQTAGRSEARRGGAKHGEAVARRCGTADGASKKRTQQPRPCGRNTFITTSYAPRPDWPVVRDTLSHLLLHTPRRRKETRDKDDTHTNTHGSRSQNKPSSDRDVQQGSASRDTG